MKKTSRGLLAVGAREFITQTHQVAVDDFNEVPGRKREALQRAARNGHEMGPWHRRPNDPYGRWNAFCRQCNRLAVVATEPPDYLAEPVYGHALTTRCAS